MQEQRQKNGVEESNIDKFAKYCGNVYRETKKEMEEKEKHDKIMKRLNSLKAKKEIEDNLRNRKSMIRIKRPSRVANLFENYHIYINEMVVGSICNGESIIYEVKPGVNKLSCKHGAMKNKAFEFKVDRGECLTIKIDNKSNGGKYNQIYYMTAGSSDAFKYKIISREFYRDNKIEKITESGTSSYEIDMSEENSLSSIRKKIYEERMRYKALPPKNIKPLVTEKQLYIGVIVFLIIMGILSSIVNS